MTQSNYLIREYSPEEDENEVLALIQEGMGGGQTGTRDVEFWRWKHHDNPFGQSISLVAVNNSGKIIGLRTLMRWRFTINEKVINAVRAVDTVTHPEARRYGIFSSLTRQAIDKVKENGIDIIFNTPNEQVLPGYLKLGWKYVSLIRPMVRILNYPKFITQMFRNLKKSRASSQISTGEVLNINLPTMKQLLSDHREIDQLVNLQKQIYGTRLSTDHFLEYLKWRYANHPYVDYRVVCYQQNSVFNGLLVLRPTTRYGLKELIVNEIFLSESNKRAGNGLFHELMQNTRADYLIAYSPQKSYRRQILRRNGFLQVPMNGQNFTINVLNPKLDIDPLDINNWELSLGDLEMF